MRNLVKQYDVSRLVEVDSAGTSAYHEGDTPDSRSISAARARGIVVGGRARQFRTADFDRFDYVLAMDERNLQDLEAMYPEGAKTRPVMLLSFDPLSPPGAGVPDPYYGGKGGFEHVLDLCERACAGLLEHILTKTGKGA